MKMLECNYCVSKYEASHDKSCARLYGSMIFSLVSAVAGTISVVCSRSFFAVSILVFEATFVTSRSFHSVICNPNFRYFVR